MGDKDSGKAKGNGTKVTFHVSKEGDFPDWYEQIVKTAEICDNRYPLKGMVAWMPYGYQALKLLMRSVELFLDESGHDEVSMPSLVPESIFKKERDFLKGFNGEAYVVTQVNDAPLEEKLFVRPTSETVIYEVVRLWINSISDLPMRLYQTVNVFRHETKQTKPMLRVREVVRFNEAHTFHATQEDADRQIKEARALYRRIFDSFLLPYLELKTPSWDTFPGAKYNYDFMTILPDGKGLELGSVIHLGDKFAKVYDLTYQSDTGSRYVQTTCYGVSERLLGAVLAVHGDDKGLILPPAIAPVQVVIVPILKKGKEEAVLAEADKLVARLKKAGYRAVADRRDKGVGDKFYHWEARGVPLRVELGLNEIKTKELVLFRRDTGDKTKVPEHELELQVSKLFKSIQESLRSRAQASFKGKLRRFPNLKEAKEYAKGADKLGIIGVPWCEDEACGKKLEAELGAPVIGYDDEKGSDKPCAMCKKAGKHELFFGRTY
jgi:prolyl-tRNA synthetase